MYKLLKKICKIIKLPIRKMSFGKFGSRSDIVKPILVTGKKNIFIGNRVFIRNGARIEAITLCNNSFYNPKLEIRDNVIIEQFVHMTCSKSIVIGHDTTISSFVYISDTRHGIEKTDVNVLFQEIESEPVSIGEYSFIGTGVKILPGVNIGKNVIIGAGAVVNKDIPDYCMAVGIPAKIIKKYDLNKKEWVIWKGEGN